MAELVRTNKYANQLLSWGKRSIAQEHRNIFLYVRSMPDALSRSVYQFYRVTKSELNNAPRSMIKLV